MADPTSVALIADTWTAVAINVTDGLIRRGETNDEILYTYRETGGSAPTHVNDNGLATSALYRFIEISHGSPIDVYLRSKGDTSTVVVML